MIRHVVGYYYQKESSSSNKNESDEDKNMLIELKSALDSCLSFYDRCYTMPHTSHTHVSHTKNNCH